jgi:hypothetical protein
VPAGCLLRPQMACDRLRACCREGWQASGQLSSLKGRECRVHACGPLLPVRLWWERLAGLLQGGTAVVARGKLERAASADVSVRPAQVPASGCHLAAHSPLHELPARDALPGCMGKMRVAAEAGCSGPSERGLLHTWQRAAVLVPPGTSPQLKHSIL